MPTFTDHDFTRDVRLDLASSAVVLQGVVDLDVDTSIPHQPTYRISVQDSRGVIYKTGGADGTKCRVRTVTG